MLDVLVVRSETRTSILSPGGVRTNLSSDDSRRILLVSESDFGRKSGAQAVLSREGDSCDALKNGAFACRLVSTDDQLREVNHIANAIGSDLLDLIQSIARLIASKVTEHVTLRVSAVGN